VLVDGAQSVSHMRSTCNRSIATSSSFPATKVFGPTGIGVVYGKQEVLEHMAALAGGRQYDRRRDIREDDLSGPPSASRRYRQYRRAVGLGAALDYVEQIGMEVIARYEHDLLACDGEDATPCGPHFIGTAARRRRAVLRARRT